MTLLITNTLTHVKEPALCASPLSSAHKILRSHFCLEEDKKIL